MSTKMSGSTKAVLALVVVIAIVIPIVLGTVLVTGATGAGGPLGLPSKTATAPSTSTSSSSISGQTQSVTIPAGAGNGANFSPSTLTVTSGTTITFTNQDTGVTHNVDFQTVPAGSTVTAGTTSPNLKGGNSYSVTLTTPGTYTYVCDFHSWMKGTITVTG